MFWGGFKSKSSQSQKQIVTKKNKTLAQQKTPETKSSSVEKRNNFMTRSVKRKLFEQQGKTFKPTTIVKKSYVRKRKRDVTEGEAFGKIVETHVLST